jgi:hypothetical protein
LPPSSAVKAMAGWKFCAVMIGGNVVEIGYWTHAHDDLPGTCIFTTQGSVMPAISAHGFPSIVNRLHSEYPPSSTILEAIYRSYGYRGGGRAVEVGEVMHHRHSRVRKGRPYRQDSRQRERLEFLPFMVVSIHLNLHLSSLVPSHSPMSSLREDMLSQKLA